MIWFATRYITFVDLDLILETSHSVVSSRVMSLNANYGADLPRIDAYPVAHGHEIPLGDCSPECMRAKTATCIEDADVSYQSLGQRIMGAADPFCCPSIIPQARCIVQVAKVAEILLG